LYSELYPNREMNRDGFEEVLGAMARGGLVRLSDAVFEKNGKQIPYRRVGLTRAGKSIDEATPVEFIMKDTAPASIKRKRKKKTPVSVKRKQVRRPHAAAQSTKRLVKAEQSTAGQAPRIEEALRVWRLAEARRLGVPAFRIFSDQALRAIATKLPGTAAELLAIPGIGISTVEKYGAQIYRILHQERR
jgi:superfamily II DNA helicase RecQ